MGDTAKDKKRYFILYFQRIIGIWRLPTFFYKLALGGREGD